MPTQKKFFAPGLTLQTARANRVYVAGPMTGIAHFNYPAFNAVTDQLRALGYEVENPQTSASSRGRSGPTTWPTTSRAWGCAV